MTTTQTQLRRDTAANLILATPVSGEPAWDTTNKRLCVGDGSTLGGVKHASAKDIQNQTFEYATVGGTGNAITLTHSPVRTAYAAGQRTVFKATNNSNSAVTANSDGIGVRDVKFMSNGALAALDADNVIVSGGIYELLDDGTQMQIRGLEVPTPAGSGLVYLGTETASASTELDLTSLMSATYDDYIIVLDNLLPGTDGANLLLRTSVNNGGAFDAGGSDYFYVATMLTAPATTAVSGSSGATAITIASGVSSNASVGGVSGEVKIFNSNNASSWQGIHFDTDYGNGTSGTTYRSFSGKGRRAAGTPTAIDAIRILPSTGNITSGSVKIYGISKA